MVVLFLSILYLFFFISLFLLFCRSLSLLSPRLHKKIGVSTSHLYLSVIDKPVITFNFYIFFYKCHFPVLSSAYLICLAAFLSVICCLCSCVCVWTCNFSSSCRLIVPRTWLLAALANPGKWKECIFWQAGSSFPFNQRWRKYTHSFKNKSAWSDQSSDHVTMCVSWGLIEVDFGVEDKAVSASCPGFTATLS